MEKKQNVKPTTIEDQIEVLWKENPRIPFMQSKEILSFGYKQGIESVTSVFSGAGGLSLGAEMAGIQISYGIEIDPSAAKSFTRNHNIDIAILRFFPSGERTEQPGFQYGLGDEDDNVDVNADDNAGVNAHDNAGQSSNENIQQSFIYNMSSSAILNRLIRWGWLDS